jgi:hypothetical protein
VASKRRARVPGQRWHQVPLTGVFEFSFSMGNHSQHFFGHFLRDFVWQVNAAVLFTHRLFQSLEVK